MRTTTVIKQAINEVLYIPVNEITPTRTLISFQANSSDLERISATICARLDILLPPISPDITVLELTNLTDESRSMKEHRLAQARKTNKNYHRIKRLECSHQ